MFQVLFRLLRLLLSFRSCFIEAWAGRVSFVFVTRCLERVPAAVLGPDEWMGDLFVVIWKPGSLKKLLGAS